MTFSSKNMNQGYQHQAAIHDFRQARRLANLEQLKSLFTGRSADLLSYDEVIKTLKITGYASKNLQDIPLNAIVGSVGRYADFTRSFFPKQDHDESRWAGVQQGFTSMEGVPPIEVYQVGEAYFVIDGNHRVSVARQLDATHIQAYVTEIRTTIPLSSDTQPDDLIINAEYKEFLKHVRLDELRPESYFKVTVPGQYELLEKQIAYHCFALLDKHPELSLDDAIRHWHDMVYLPVVKVIRERGMLGEFPERTETDLYLWISAHLYELQHALGWRISAETAAPEFVKRFSPKLPWVFSRIAEKAFDLITPPLLEAGPETGEWRRERATCCRPDRLFGGILVPLSGEARSWCALEQAITVARRENAALYGLHIVPSADQKMNPQALTTCEEFHRLCRTAGVSGEFAIEAGDIPLTICERIRWTDLAAIHLMNPPGPNPISRWRSPFRTIVRRASRPVLAVPKIATPLDRPLLAYDGSPKANEALYVSTYLAGQWQIPLIVVSVDTTRRRASEALAAAQDYLTQYGIQATFVQKSGAVGTAIFKTAEEHGSNVIIMGGYDQHPLIELLFGSIVEVILRESQLPMLICR